MTLYITLGVVAVFVATLYFIRRDSRKRGEAEAINKSQNEVLNDIHTANIVRDRLRHDGKYADRVQDRFTRS